MEIYSYDNYLKQFDDNILNYIEQAGKFIDKNKRMVEIIIKDKVKQYVLHDIKWVIQEVDVTRKKFVIIILNIYLYKQKN